VAPVKKDDTLGGMPLLNEDDIKALIAENAIGAISVDTSVFDKYQCNLESQALLGLGQFRGTATRLVLSEVIAGEVKSHIEREAAESQVKLKSALAQVRKGWRIVVDHPAVDAALGNTANPCRLCR
jgi:predicted nucleic acid-binding protein